VEVEAMKKQMKPFVWGVVGGCAVLLIVIFAAGWVVTSGSAQAASEEMAAKAVVDRLAPICVLQYQKDPKNAERLAELAKTSSWNQGDYVKKAGWATMPGEKEASSDVANECSKLILALKEKAK
jgi:hypothetical protein